jgi:hypothetical protein
MMKRHLLSKTGGVADASKRLMPRPTLCDRVAGDSRSPYLTNRLKPLPHYRVGGKILVRESEFDAWVHQFVGRQHGSDLNLMVAAIVDGFVK